MSPIEICFAVDNKFIKQLCVAIASILKNAADDDILNIYVMTEGLTDENVAILNGLKSIKTFNLEIINVDVSLFKNYVSPTYINSNATFYRYLIPELKPKLDKVLYLDCDIVVTTSLSELYNTKLGDNYIAGVEDCHEACIYSKLKDGFDINEPYFNAGVLLFNCSKMRRDKFSEKCFTLTNKLNTKTYHAADQDVLNILTQGHKLLLPPRDNVISAIFYDTLGSRYTGEELLNAVNHPVIIHFTGKRKPWMISKFPVNKFSFEYYKYLKLTPFYSSKDKYRLLFYNKNISKMLQKLQKNPVVQLLFGICSIPFNIFSIVKAVLNSRKLLKEFDERTSL